MIIGQRIKEERIKKGYSQQELGDLLGITKVSICGYEKGTRTPTMANFLDLIKVLEVNPDYLLGRDGIGISEDIEKQQVTIAKEDIVILKEFKNNKILYNKLCADPKRMVELIARRIK
ncbi:MAG: helix-turn-helix transcriptional regulator [Bacilli bacterium]